MARQFSGNSLDKTGDEEIVPANVPARLKAEPIVGLADLGDRGFVGVVESPLHDNRPVLELHLLGMQHGVTALEEIGRLTEPGYMSVECVEHCRQFAKNQ